MTDEILEIGDLDPIRAKVRLRTKANPEGAVYELAIPEDFGAVDCSRIGAEILEMDRLWGLKDLSETDGQALVKLCNTIAGKLIPEAQTAEIEALPDVTKRAVALRFFVQSGSIVHRIGTAGTPAS